MPETVPSLHSPSGTRRILSRLASPFGNKNRNVPEFFVQADDPHKHYTPGEIIAGSVILKVIKPIRVTHIVVCLHGFVQVYKNPGAPPADGFRANKQLLAKGRGSRSGAEYFGNGFASLFEDETVVCGDGRLEEGNYKFEFRMRFPETTLPSSIDFERGTVSYMITATMTRPTSIAPTTHHDQKVYFAEQIEISRLLPPRPRTITLEPLVRRPRGKARSRRHNLQADSSRLQPGNQDGSLPGSPSTARNASPFSTSVTPLDETAPRSPSPSNRSLDSQQSSNCPTSISGSMVPSSSRASDSMSGFTSHASGRERNITVTVESLKGGCLRGDSIPMKITVNHTKHIKSVQGVIVTLYRHARVDTHPAIPIGPMSEKDRKRLDDYYPKSYTGLGGLSLSGAGSSHVFRKDLSQLVLPLMIDHRTLTAELLPKLRVPENCFPTISCVPGAMISFKYYVEVIIDVQAKLAGQDRYFNTANGANHDNNQFLALGDIEGGAREARSGAQLFERSIIDTAPIRRDKSVVTCVFEVVIGTKDSERAKGKAKATDTTIRATETIQLGTQFESNTDTATMTGGRYAGPLEQTRENQSRLGARTVMWDPNPPQRTPVSPPQFDDDETLTEKERLRRAEVALMPSQPPDMDEHFASRAQPSAPMLDEEYPDSTWQNWEGQYDESGHDWSSAEASHYPEYWEYPEGEPSAPSYNVVSNRVGPEPYGNDIGDKQEARRRELELQASQPPTTDDNAELPDRFSSPSSHRVPTEQEVGQDPNLPKAEASVQDVGTGLAPAEDH